jgi:hypothetical protein
MATFNDIAKEYAEKIKTATNRTTVTKTASTNLIEKAIKESDPLIVVLKNIQYDLDSRRYSDTNKPLSKEDREFILKQTGVLLGLERPDNLAYVVKEASNENAISLLSYMTQLLNDIK